MNPLTPKPDTELEAKIQEKLMNFLTLEKWYCLKTHGNAYQSGFPDIFACHRRFGSRWIEVKKPVGSCYTKAQLHVFTKLSSKGIGVWTLVGYSQYERDKLFKLSNWHTLLFSSSGIKMGDAPKRIRKVGPEGKIQDAIINKLQQDDWFCIETYGSMYQSGFPDIYCCHKKYGAKWIECKNPNGYSFTPAQTDTFPCLAAQGVGIWILTSVDEIGKLFLSPNWHTYMWK